MRGSATPWDIRRLGAEMAANGEHSRCRLRKSSRFIVLDKVSLLTAKAIEATVIVRLATGPARSSRSFPPTGRSDLDERALQDLIQRPPRPQRPGGTPIMSAAAWVHHFVTAVSASLKRFKVWLRRPSSGPLRSRPDVDGALRRPLGRFHGFVEPTLAS
jgi:hypothetical protein